MTRAWRVLEEIAESAPLGRADLAAADCCRPESAVAALVGARYFAALGGRTVQVRVGGDAADKLAWPDIPGVGAPALCVPGSAAIGRIVEIRSVDDVESYLRAVHAATGDVKRLIVVARVLEEAASNTFAFSREPVAYAAVTARGRGWEFAVGDVGPGIVSTTPLRPVPAHVIGHYVETTQFTRAGSGAGGLARIWRACRDAHDQLGIAAPELAIASADERALLTATGATFEYTGAPGPTVISVSF